MSNVMRVLTRPPLRLRITLAATVSLAAILVTLSLFVYGRLRVELERAVDSGLQARAVAVASGLGPTASLSQVIADGPDARLASLTQIMTPAGQVLASQGAPLRLPPAMLTGRHGPHFSAVAGPAGRLRLYIQPVNEGRPLLVVVASTLTSVDQTLGSLRLLLLLGDPAALALASVVAYLVTGAALRPIERMRREAAAISVTDLAIRLAVPGTHDEVARLGETLNSLLDRLQAAIDHERRLLDDASHELRTPLSALKAELDLALSRQRSALELQQALLSASEETNRLSRLAQDLLVLSRSRDDGLEIHRVSTALGPMLERICERHRPRAAQAGYGIDCEAPDTKVALDPMRVTQAIDNLLDNAVRYAAGDGSISVLAEVADHAVTITVTNPGPGFPTQIIDRAFDPFVSGSHVSVAGYLPAPAAEAHTGRPAATANQPGAGLGLAIVQAVARAHGGFASATNVPGGASVALTLARAPASLAGFCEPAPALRTETAANGPGGRALPVLTFRR
jgi:two-component system OmpR family sensor kinase